jgi:2-hydroxychromene-2-carboxylate isomerase
MNQKLKTLYVTWLLDPRFVALREAAGDMGRIVTFRKRVVSVFLQLDDPYSYLLSHYLDSMIARYRPKVRFRVYLCQALSGEYTPQPGMLADYALLDATRIAQAFDIPFLDRGAAPVVEFRRPLLDFLATEQDEDDFPEIMNRALAAYWRGDAEAVRKLLGRPAGGSDETNVLVGKNQLLLRKMGHYSTATMHYAGEWYWGLDRLPHLLRRLDGQKLNRSKDPMPGIESMMAARKVTLPATAPAAARELPPLELYHSFRSPYSYLVLRPVFAIAAAYGLKLVVKPILPIATKGSDLPAAKRLYIVKDANREARRRKIPFGKIADPVGEGAERCIAAFCYARTQNRHFDFLQEAGKAIFAEGLDVATDEGMQVVAERAGLFWPELQEGLKDEHWRHEARENRDALAEAGHWGVPTMIIGEHVFWGQDRDWLLAHTIEDLCQGSEGIMV